MSSIRLGLRFLPAPFFGEAVVSDFEVMRVDLSHIDVLHYKARYRCALFALAQLIACVNLPTTVMSWGSQSVVNPPKTRKFQCRNTFTWANRCCYDLMYCLMYA
ncbi:MAG TPA: hypothetical protein VGD30_02205, partial [Telluria sp.]